MKIYVITVLLAVVVATSAETQNCPEGRVFKECGSACEKTCEDYMRSLNEESMCTLQCVPGCYCMEGSYENMKGLCVDAETCEDLDRTCEKGDDRCIIGNDIIKVEGILKGFGKGIPDRILPKGLKIIDGFIDGSDPTSRPEPRPTGEDRPTRPSRTDGVKPPSRPIDEERPTRPDRPYGSKPPSRPTGEDRPEGERPTRPDRPEGSKPPSRPTGEDRPTRPGRPEGERPIGGRPTRPDRPGGDRSSSDPRPGREGRNRRAHWID